MGKMKATKRLIRAIIAFVASVVLCIGACLAWFAANEKAHGDGLNSEIKPINIKTFTVTAYKLTEKESTTAEANIYTMGDEIKSNPVVMEAYGDLTKSTTALLLKIKYEFGGTDNKEYDVFAECSTSDAPRKIIEHDVVNDSFKFNLSDAVHIFTAVELTNSDTEVTVTAKTQKTFITQTTTGGTTADVKQNVTLNDTAITDTALNGIMYCVIDYYDAYIFELYALALEYGGTLSSKIDFAKDIKFGMAEKTTETTN